ncbi:MAG: hypothetical protein JNL67_09895 [Planctomycetaceae bacterium]|nr:hypothetical protein [Planctomycetaceae bacterium]
MLSTFILFAIFGGQLIISAMLWGYLLRLGLLWAGVPDVTTWGVVIATSLWVILGVLINVSFIVAANGSNVNPDGLALMQLVGSIALPSAVICAVFRTRLLRAVQAWLPTLLADFVTLLFVYLVLKPVLYEAFIVPTNGMAPTLLGQHWQAVCPTCGAPNYCTPRDARFGNPGPQPMICENFHVHSVAVVDTTVHDSDRFIVAKFLNPRRWDLVVFQSPEEPSLVFVSRLIGLPG